MQDVTLTVVCMALRINHQFILDSLVFESGGRGTRLGWGTGSDLSQPLIRHEANDSAGVSEPQPSRERISYLYTYRPLQATHVLRRGARRPYYY